MADCACGRRAPFLTWVGSLTRAEAERKHAHERPLWPSKPRVGGFLRALLTAWCAHLAASADPEVHADLSRTERASLGCSAPTTWNKRERSAFCSRASPQMPALCAIHAQ